MPPPKVYQVMRKGRVQTVSKAQYYRLKAQDGGANTRTPDLQALLVARAQADAPIASSSTSTELTRERARSIQSGDVDMTLDENAPEDEVNFTMIMVSQTLSLVTRAILHLHQTLLLVTRAILHLHQTILLATRAILHLHQTILHLCQTLLLVTRAILHLCQTLLLVTRTGAPYKMLIWMKFNVLRVSAGTKIYCNPFHLFRLFDGPL
ncbi:hypothetical protein EDB19DRAFT_1980378 [Suillus lakei]|nr:hypothetical protein EDB19DRAFT_1980378 [Suillus lakei]